MKTVLNNTIATALPNYKKNLINDKLEVVNTKLDVRSGRLEVSNGKLRTLVMVLLIIAVSSCRVNKETICVPPTVTTTYYKATPLKYEWVTLTGKVVDKLNNPIANVTLQFDNKLTEPTSSDGLFTYSDSVRTDKVYQLIAKKQGYNNTIQSYHSLMGNANFNMALGIPCKCDSTITEDFCSCIKPIDLLWTSNFIAENNTQLNSIADCLKRNPTCNLIITYLLGDANKTAVASRLETVKKYLVNKGITEQRINLLKIQNTTNATNLIHIEKQ